MNNFGNSHPDISTYPSSKCKFWYFFFATFINDNRLFTLTYFLLSLRSNLLTLLICGTHSEGNSAFVSWWTLFVSAELHVVSEVPLSGFCTYLPGYNIGYGRFELPNLIFEISFGHELPSLRLFRSCNGPRWGYLGHIDTFLLMSALVIDVGKNRVL